MSKSKTNLGKLPPSDIDLEQAVLGAILNVKDSIIRVYKDFKPDLFYKESHVLIAESILKLHHQSRKIDLLTVISELRENKKLDIVGGAYYITEIMDRVVSSAHLEEHLEILKKLYVARKQIEVYSNKVGELYDLIDPYDVANEVGNTLISLQEDSSSENEFTIRELANESIRERETLGNKIIDKLGYSTGVHELDKVIMGIKSPDLTIIAGRPAMGKTAVALTLLKSIASEVPVSFFSLEMGAMQLYKRILSAESSVWSKKIKRNDLTENERLYLSQADQNLAELPIVFNDTPALNIDRFRSMAIIHKKKYGTKAIIIDYLGLMKGNTKGYGNNTAEITEISGKLKRVAKELQIPIIALAQLSRAVESRKDEDFRPKLSDLRESGSIEQDADNVIFLWRPEYYGLEKPIGIRGYETEFLPKNLLMFIVAKCRDGETKSVPAFIDLSKMQVKDHPTIQQQETLPF